MTAPDPVVAVIAEAIAKHRWYTTGTAAFLPGVYGCQGCELSEFKTLTAFEAHQSNAVAAAVREAGLAAPDPEFDAETARLLQAALSWIAGAISEDPSGEPWLMSRTLLNELTTRVDELGGWPRAVVAEGEQRP